MVREVSAVLAAFGNNSIELLRFLKTIRQDDLEQLKDYLNEYDEGGVSTQTILDLVSIWEYMNEINSLGKQDRPADFAKLIQFIFKNL